MQHETHGQELPQACRLTISVAFWCALGLSSVMFAMLSLAPRIIQNSALHRRYESNRQEETRLQAEIEHLSKVAHALESDPEFIARVTRTELDRATVGAIEIRVDDDLGYDPRVPQFRPPLDEPAPPWYLGFFESLSSPTPLRTRWLIATTGLCAVAFICLNEEFFSGSLGKLLLVTVTAILGRYVTPISREHH